MNLKINLALEQIRSRLDESAWGPEISPPRDFGFETGKAGELEAENHSDIMMGLEKYISGLVDALLVQYNLSDDEAVDLAFEALDSLVSDGATEEIPGEDASDDQVAMWLGQATTSGLQRKVDEYARKAMYGRE